MLPLPSKTGGGQDSDDEVWESNFAEVISCNYAAGSEKSSWIDSGATNHLTGDFSRLRNLKRLDGSSKISMPIGATATVTHKGEVKLHNEVVLKDTLYVPTFKHNLLSVQKLVQDGGYLVEFYPTYCTIQDRRTHEIKGVGKTYKGLYYLVDKDMSSILKSGSEAIVTDHSSKEIKAMCAKSVVQVPSVITNMKPMSEETLWHHRLGHAPMSKIKKIDELKNVRNSSGDVCVICPQAKFTKLKYQRSDSRAHELFELVHVDIWGPYKVETRQHCKFFITIVDDCSRAIWVHLLKHKSDAFQAIQEFVNMAMTQHGKKIKVIRSDNALEFSDNKCKSFYAEQGIIHQTSCVDRPQQNGRVERKHRNILEMSRALRFQSGLPLQFWGDCVQAAVYITNRLPTPLLNNRTPYEVIFNKKPKYSSMKTFGCLAMASNPSRVGDKFAG